MKKLTSQRVASERDLSSHTKQKRQPTTRFSVLKLGSPTWPDFVRVVEKHTGVWGGCWCTAFHLKRSEEKEWAGKHKALKEKLVRENRSHSALVYEGRDIVGWCQFGPPLELPSRMSGYGKLDVAPPDWRVTCFFVDRDHRREGVARAALEGALRLIAAKGGGTVDGYPIDTRENHTQAHSYGVEPTKCSQISGSVRSVNWDQANG